MVHSGLWNTRLPRRWFNVIICRLDVNALVINHMAFFCPIIIDFYQSKLVRLSLIPVFELHLDKSKTTTLSGDLVPHDYSVSYVAVLFEELDEVRFLRLIS